MPDVAPIDWKNPSAASDAFAALDVTLTEDERAAIVEAFTNMSQADETKRGHVDKFASSPFGLLETRSVDKPEPGDGAKIALDPDAFQIIRYHDSTKADMPWVRFGLQRTPPVGNDFQPFVRHSMYQPDDGSSFDLGRDVPEVARRLNLLWGDGTRVLALLGAARLGVKDGMALLEPVQQLVAGLAKVAYMTGGYRGEVGKNYGVTRAGFDVPKSKGRETLVVMCAAGLKDAHQTAAAMSIYGNQWGDDTPGLCTASDAAVFFRHIPKESVYGKWTEVEIANFVHQKKPLVIFDPQAGPTVTAETHFGVPVPVFKTADEVAAYLNPRLPDPEAIQDRAQLTVKPADPNTTPPVPPHEDYMAVRLYKVDPETDYARWVRQGDEGRKPFRDARLEFREAGIVEGRDLVLDGYWKDIMLMQYFHKLPQTEGEIADDNLAGAYAGLRKTLEQKQRPRWPWWDLVNTPQDKGGHAIDGIWFMWPVEHQTGVFDLLPDWQPTDEYSRKLQGG